MPRLRLLKFKLNELMRKTNNIIFSMFQMLWLWLLKNVLLNVFNIYLIHEINYSDSYEPMYPKLAYSKTCVKRPLKNRQNKDLNDKW